MACTDACSNNTGDKRRYQLNHVSVVREKADYTNVFRNNQGHAVQAWQILLTTQDIQII